jgi:hypothetical protein
MLLGNDVIVQQKDFKIINGLLITKNQIRHLIKINELKKNILHKNNHTCRTTIPKGSRGQGNGLRNSKYSKLALFFSKAISVKLSLTEERRELSLLFFHLFFSEAISVRLCCFFLALLKKGPM